MSPAPEMIKLALWNLFILYQLNMLIDFWKFNKSESHETSLNITVYEKSLHSKIKFRSHFS